MPGAIFLEGDKVNLRTVEEEDLEFLRNNVNHPEVRTFLTTRKPVNMEQEKEFFKEVISNDEPVNLAICSNNQITGIIELREKKEGVGEIGIWIAPDYHQKGYGTEASRLLIDYAFNQLRYHKIYTGAFESNKASQKVWKKLGFQKEGELREQVYRNGEFENLYYYGILEKEWE